jgi:LCP family protein required for cell wall assembly
VSEVTRSSADAGEASGAPRHGRLKRAAAWKAVLSFVGAGLAVVLVSGSAVAGIAVWQLQDAIDTVTIDADDIVIPPQVGAYEGSFNVLLVGSDTRLGQGGLGGTESSTLNDVNMLLHVAADRQSATLVSIPRDMVVPMPRCSEGGPASGLPINNTLSYGGLDCTVQTVQNLTGLTIDFAGLITFRGVVELSNAIGGVDVCTDDSIVDPMAGLNIQGAGLHTLSGEQALAFLRSRHGVGDGSDLGRISSQQVFLSSLVRKIKSDGTLTDLSKLYGIAQAATQNMQLSNNFSRLDVLVSVALVLKDVPLENITMVQYPGRTGGTGIYAGKVQPVTSIANQLFDAIRADVPIALDGNAVGANGGSTLDPNAPTPDPSASPIDGVPAGQLIAGLKGQTAAQYTCSAAN